MTRDPKFNENQEKMVADIAGKVDGAGETTVVTTNPKEAEHVMRTVQLKIPLEMDDEFKDVAFTLSRSTRHVMLLALKHGLVYLKKKNDIKPRPDWKKEEEAVLAKKRTRKS